MYEDILEQVEVFAPGGMKYDLRYMLYPLRAYPNELLYKVPVHTTSHCSQIAVSVSSRLYQTKFAYYILYTTYYILHTTYAWHAMYICTIYITYYIPHTEYL